MQTLSIENPTCTKRKHNRFFYLRLKNPKARTSIRALFLSYNLSPRQNRRVRLRGCAANAAHALFCRAFVECITSRMTNKPAHKSNAFINHPTPPTIPRFPALCPETAGSLKPLRGGYRPSASAALLHRDLSRLLVYRSAQRALIARALFSTSTSALLYRPNDAPLILRGQEHLSPNLRGGGCFLFSLR